MILCIYNTPQLPSLKGLSRRFPLWISAQALLDSHLLSQSPKHFLCGFGSRLFDPFLLSAWTLLFVRCRIRNAEDMPVAVVDPWFLDGFHSLSFFFILSWSTTQPRLHLDSSGLINGLEDWNSTPKKSRLALQGILCCFLFHTHKKNQGKQLH